MKTISVLIIEPEEILQFVNDRFLTIGSSIQIQQTEEIENALYVIEKKHFDLILFDFSWDSFENLKKRMATVKEVSVNKDIICAWQYSFLAKVELDSFMKKNELAISKPLIPMDIYRLCGQARDIDQ